MDLTATDIENHEFTQGRKGYAPEEVDRFLDEVAAQFRRYDERLASMAQRVAALEAELSQTRETEEMTRRMLLVAQRASDEAVAEAEQKAQALLEDAQRRSQGLEEEIRRRRSSLETDIEALKRFEAELRAQIRQSLEAHLALLQRTGRASAEGVAPKAPAPAVPAARPQVQPGPPGQAPSPGPPGQAPSPGPPGHAPPPGPPGQAASPGLPAAPSPQPSPAPPSHPPVRVADNEVLRRLAEGGRPDAGPGR